MNVRRLFLTAIMLLAIPAVGGALVLQLGIAQGLPDIVVTNPVEIQTELTTTLNNVVFPTVEQGETATIIATISNSRPTPLAESFTVEFLSRNGSTGQETSLDETSITCLNFPNATDPSFCTINGLAGVGNDGDSVEIRAELNTSVIQPDAAPYVILVRANMVNPIAGESDTTNNTGEGSILINERTPNLVMLAEFAISPALPNQGDLLNVEFTVENDRLEDVNFPVDTSISIRKRNGGGTFGPFTTLVAPSMSCRNCESLRLASGLRATIQAQIITTLVEAGEYEMQITVDSANELLEFNEADNTLTFDFVLGQPPRNLSIGGSQLFPIIARPNEIFTLNFGVTNESFAAATNVPIKLSRKLASESDDLAVELISPILTCTTNGGGFSTDISTGNLCGLIQSISGNQTLALQLQFQLQTELDLAAIPAGDYELILELDSGNAFDESNESDNVLRIPFTLADQDPVGAGGTGDDDGETEAQRGPELHPTSVDLTPTSPITQGESILVQSNVRNSGNQDAHEFEVRFSYRLEDGSNGAFTIFETQSIAVLKVGLAVDLKATLDTSALGLGTGFYSIKVEVLSPNEIELDTENNSVIAFFTLSQ
jgi:hypothetical protein